MTTMPVEIFSDHIDDNEEPPKSNKSLSKMNKSELYEFSKKLVKENQKLQLFVNSSEEDKDNLEDKIVEQDVEISNLKLELEEAKSYEKSFNEVKANKDDIEEDLSEEINNLQKEIRELKEKDKKAEEIFKIIEDKIIIHLREEDE